MKWWDIIAQVHVGKTHEVLNQTHIACDKLMPYIPTREICPGTIVAPALYLLRGHVIWGPHAYLNAPACQREVILRGRSQNLSA